MNREEIIAGVEKNRIIVIVRGVEREKLIPFAEAVYAGGIRMLEITYDASGETTDEETENSIRMLAEHFRGRMAIGAGTVLTVEQVERTSRAGGGFIISPDVNEQVIRRTRELSLVSMPGGYTPTEIASAARFGADFVKLFPAGGLGPGFLKDVKAPLSHVRFLAVGGIDLHNIRDFRKAGAVGFGIGSGIVKKDLIRTGAYEAITELAEAYVKETTE